MTGSVVGKFAHPRTGKAENREGRVQELNFLRAVDALRREQGEPDLGGEGCVALDVTKRGLDASIVQALYP